MPVLIPRILVVDDHLDTARAVCKMLSFYGYLPKCASTVAEGIRLGLAEPFDLLLCDIGLPDGDGTEILRRLLEQRPIKGIVMSGYGMPADIEHSLAAGFCAHLTKPVSFDALNDLIKQAFPGHPTGSDEAAATNVGL